MIDGASDTRLTTTDVCGEAFGLAVDAELNRVYVSCRNGYAIATVDGATNTVLSGLQVPLGGEPYAVALDPVAWRLYVAFSPEANNPRRLLAYGVSGGGLQWQGSADVGNGGANGGGGIGVDTATGHIFVTNSQDGTVTVIDGPTLLTLATIPTGSDPMPVAVDPSIYWAYVGNRGGNSLVALPDNW